MEAETDDSGFAEKSVCTRMRENENCSTIEMTSVEKVKNTICGREHAGVDNDMCKPNFDNSNTGTCIAAAESSHVDVGRATAEISDIPSAERSRLSSLRVGAGAAESPHIDMRRASAESSINTADRFDKIDAFNRNTAETRSSEKCDNDAGKIGVVAMGTTLMESLGLQRVRSTDTVKTGQDFSQNTSEKPVPCFAEKPVSVRTEKNVPAFTEKFPVRFVESAERMMQFAEILYKCKLCTSLPSILTSKDNFLSHVKDFHLKGNCADDFDCDDCDLKFRTSEDLNLHFSVCHGSCEENETYTSYSGAKYWTSTVSNINTFSSRDSKSADICDMDKSSSEVESESDDMNIGSSSNNCEILSSKPKMFNFSGGRATKSRSRKSVPKRRSDGRVHIENNRCDIGESLIVKVEPCDADVDGCQRNLTSVDPGVAFHESENNRKRKLTHILSPGQQTHTIHWGRGPSDINLVENVETSEPVCKKIKILDKVVKIPNPNCADDNSSDSDKVGHKLSLGDVDGSLQSTPLMQPVPAIHDMQKYSKYLSRKSFFSMEAHQKLKSSAIYNLISTHMQKDTVAGTRSHHEEVSQRENVYHNFQHDAQQNVPKSAQQNLPESAHQNVPKNTTQNATRSPNFRNLSASDRLKAFIKHKSDDHSKKRTGHKTHPAEQSLEGYVQMEPEDFSSTSARFTSTSAKLSSHHKNEQAASTSTCPSKTYGILPGNCLTKCTLASGPEGQYFESVAESFQKHPYESCTSGTDKQYKSTVSLAASSTSTSSHDIDLPKTNPLPLLNMPAVAPYKCFKCDEYFADFSAYCNHYKKMHDSDMPYGTPIPKMEQCVALVKAIQTLLVATHSGYISRDSLLKEAAKEIGSTQVESWGAACNRAVKEVFPYSQTHRKGKYKDTYYFGVKFVEASDTAEDALETDDEKQASPGDNLWGSQQPKSATKDGGVDLERIHNILPDLVAWLGDEDAKIPRADLVDILRYELNEPETSSSNWGWQCNRAVHLYFPDVVIERRGKHKQTYYQGLYYKDPDAIKAKLANISIKRKNTSLGEEDDVYSGVSNEEVDSKSENSDPTDSEVMDEDDVMKEAADTEAHKTLKLRVCRALANTKGPLTTPRAVQKKLNNVSTVIVTAMLKELSAEGYGIIQEPVQPRGRNKVVFFKSYPGTMREEDLLSGTGISAKTYKENFRDLTDPPIRGMYHRHPQVGLMMDLIDMTCD